MTKVKAALVQVAWTGNKDSMVSKHLKYIDDAAKQGAQVTCLQELFYGPYFCQIEDRKGYAYTEKIPDGPTTKAMQERAKKHGMVLIVPSKGYRNPAPTLARTSRTGTVNPVGAPFRFGSWLRLKWVFAMQMGSLSNPCLV